MALFPRLREQPRELNLRGRPVQPLPCGPPHGAGDPEAPESSGSADVVSGPEEGDFVLRRQPQRPLGVTRPAGAELWVEVAVFAFLTEQRTSCFWPGPSLLPGVLPDVAKHSRAGPWRSGVSFWLLGQARGTSQQMPPGLRTSL